jgi:hypothetical protein
VYRQLARKAGPGMMLYLIETINTMYKYSWNSLSPTPQVGGLLLVLRFRLKALPSDLLAFYPPVDASRCSC